MSSNSDEYIASDNNNDGWFVKGGAPKSSKWKITNSRQGPIIQSDTSPPSPSSHSTPSKSSVGNDDDRKEERSFGHRHDHRQYAYIEGWSLRWNITDDIFQLITEKFPSFLNLKEASSSSTTRTKTSFDYSDFESRIILMRQIEFAHWFYTDEIVEGKMLPNVVHVSFHLFSKSILHKLASIGISLFFSPLKYSDEWLHFSRFCKTSSIALVRHCDNNPETYNARSDGREVLMIKRTNMWFVDAITSFPGGKAEDERNVTLWDVACREFKFEFGIDLGEEDKRRISKVFESGKHVLFVLPIKYDDKRFKNIRVGRHQQQQPQNGGASITPTPSSSSLAVWIPLDLDISKISEPTKRMTGDVGYRIISSGDCGECHVLLRENGGVSKNVEEDEEARNVDKNIFKMTFHGRKLFGKVKSHMHSFDLIDQKSVKRWINVDSRSLKS